MPDRLRIGLLVESSRKYGRELLRGIAEYGRRFGPWTFFYEERDLGAPLPQDAANWRLHGVIARLTGAKMISEVRKLNVPTVDLYHEDATPDIPGVTLDQGALVRLAIDHFLERGFRNFAYCGLPGVLFSEMRAEQFVEQLSERGYGASVFRCSPLSKHAGLAAIEAHVARHSDDLARWLRGLPKPVALMACNDMRGYHVISTCGARGIAVPDEVAVLGVDNDEVQCELCDPPLTSIDPEPARMGYEAAAMLHRMIRGETVPSTRLLAKPVKVVTRSSTGVLAIADRNVADAVRLLREHACQGTEFRQICAELSLSPSTLNRWCHKWLGRSPMAEITRVRIERVHELLTTTNLPLEAIAHLSGFRHVESVCRMMKRMSGKTAGEYRRQAGTLDRL